MPEEVRAAKRINQEGDRIIEKAQEQAAFLIGERGLTEAAEVESQRTIAEADQEAEDVRAGADEYASDVLATLESSVSGTLRSIERGIAMLDERRATYAPPDAPDPAAGGDGPLAYDQDEEAGASPAIRR